jgi:hypothetical protein
VAPSASSRRCSDMAAIGGTPDARWTWPIPPAPTCSGRTCCFIACSGLLLAALPIDVDYFAVQPRRFGLCLSATTFFGVFSQLSGSKRADFASSCRFLKGFSLTRRSLANGMLGDAWVIRLTRRSKKRRAEFVVGYRAGGMTANCAVSEIFRLEVCASFLRSPSVGSTAGAAKE